jgi:ESS family glutamate:Na+ symporter
MPPSSAVAIVNLNAVQVLALACVGIIAGVQIKRLIPVLDRLNVPASVVGGLIYAAVALLLRDRYMNFEMDLVLRDMFMVAFFTTIGMSASLRLLKVGGVQVALFFGLATAGVVMQNLVGVALAKLLGLHLLLGIVAGVRDDGGRTGDGACIRRGFREDVWSRGRVDLRACRGDVRDRSRGLARRLCRGFVHRATPAARAIGAGRVSAAETAEAAVYPAAEPDEPTQLRDESESESGPLMHTVVAIAVAMGVGTLISAGFERSGVRLPAYVGAMFAAGILRNIDDATRWFGISQRQMDTVGSIALNIFIVMALLTLRLWEIVNLAAPMMVIVAAQILLVWLMASLCSG